MTSIFVEVFKAGKHTDGAGITKDYSINDIELIADLYTKRIAENATDAAPLVKGHPQSNEPALGWVRQLFRKGDKLVARISDIDTALYGEIQAGKYKNYSIAISDDMSLRHIGIIGAVPPAVKGLNKNGVVFFNQELNYEEYDVDTDFTAPDLSASESFRTEEEADEQFDNAVVAMLLNDKENYADENERLLRLNDELAEQLQVLRSNNEELKQKTHIYEEERKGQVFSELAKSIPALSPKQQEEFVSILHNCYTADSENGCGEFTEYMNTADNLVNHLTLFISQLTDSGNFAQTLTHSLELEGNSISEPDNPQDKRQWLHSLAMNYMNLHPESSYERALQEVM
ncbi:MAG: hypothetical protein LBO69_00115 [Ignavibacteria bacterium]|jgi:hypothetical protein|nr:hypothetical protein [Ignavibacteria bacterium]